MHGRDVSLEGVSMVYPDGTAAVHPTDLDVRAGEFFSILGPSGCGKTTVLRLISGFLEPSAGRVSIGGEPMRGIPPARRPTALIFQNLALFPLMSVRDNVAFGLEARGMARPARRAKADELLGLVALEGQGDKRPGELSGGQRQRVAVARALAVEPAVLLLDEPLSALDLKLRQHMRGELKAIQRKTGVTFVYITHDQGEALTMSDRVAVMHAGRVEQVGTAEAIYSAPRSPFVATFVGEQNRFAGTVVAADAEAVTVETPLGRLAGTNPGGLVPGEKAELYVRPERVALLDAGDRANASGPGRVNELRAELERQDLEGPFLNLFLRAGAQPVSLHVTNDGTLPPLVVGDSRRVGFRVRDAVVMRPAPEAADGATGAPP